MKAAIRYLEYLLSLILISSCSGSSNGQKGDTLVIHFNLDKEPEDIYTVGLINDMEIYQLDSKEMLFQEINKIIRHKNRFYLMDKYGTKSAIIYDTQGRFVNVISQYGQGPEEYYQLEDIFINTEDETLNLLCRFGRKLLKYDLDGRELKEIVKLPKMFSNLSKTNWGFVGYMGDYDPDNAYAKNIWTVSEELNLIESFMDIDPERKSQYGGMRPFSHHKNSDYFIQQLDNNIYAINEKEISTPYSVNFGKANWPEDMKTYETYSNAGFDVLHKHIHALDFFQETDNHLIFTFIHEGQSRLGVYNKNTARTHYTALLPDNSKYFLSFGNIIGMDENHIYTLIDAAWVKTMILGKNEYNDFEKDYPEQINRLRERFKGVEIDEEDNPFLIVYSIN